MKKIAFFGCLAIIVIIVQASAEGVVSSYTLDITSGGASTSGGISGKGLGYLSLDGTFKLIIDSDSGQADLENIDISFSNPYCPRAFDWSSLEGTFNLGALFLSSPCSIHPNIDNSLSGTFNGDTAFMQGTIYDNMYDGYQYDCTVNAVVIPEPCTLLLLGLGAAIGVKRRYNSRSR